MEKSRFHYHDGGGRPRATSDRIHRLIVRSTVTASDSSLLTTRLFCDESRFQLCPDDHEGRVWGSPGQRADPASTIARHTGSQPGAIVRGATSFDSRTPLVVIRAHLQHNGTSTTF
ncbi:transposable element Tc1 transposase [Trichonephila clavipes]|nr:transposable element Tc1 transposase [Trichonephila clavipes]